jgi:hypothetical protein
MAVESFCPSGFDLLTSTDGTTWVNHRATVRHVNPASRDREVLTYMTSDGAVTCAGPAPETEVEIDTLYQEASAGLYALLRDAHYTGEIIQARWSPAGGTKEWFTDDARVTSFDEPDLDNDADSPLFFIATLSAPSVEWRTKPVV